MAGGGGGCEPAQPPRPLARWRAASSHRSGRRGATSVESWFRSSNEGVWILVQLVMLLGTEMAMGELYHLCMSYRCP